MVYVLILLEMYYLIGCCEFVFICDGVGFVNIVWFWLVDEVVLIVELWLCWISVVIDVFDEELLFVDYFFWLVFCVLFILYWVVGICEGWLC